MWEFVAPEDEVEEAPIPNKEPVAFRPNRMGLGCSTEIIQERISENAKKSRLEKLLKRRGGETDDGLEKTVNKVDQECSDSEFSKSKVSKISFEPTSESVLQVERTTLTKNQKKRQKLKMKQLQKRLLA